MEKTCKILRELEVLSLRPEGNYLITGANVAINPRGSLLTMHYFTRLPDAMAFRNAFYKNAMYSTPIFKEIKEPTSN